MKIISIVGTRPNLMKVSPFINIIKSHNNNSSKKIKHILIHTGQHYDDNMSKIFFKELNIPHPDINLNIGSGTHAEQVGNTMIAVEKILVKEQPDWVVVFGDVNATLASSIAAKKLNINVCHIEAGLRSNDETMPEEINRILTDRISNLLLTPDMLSYNNLINEGIIPKNIQFVGNIMIDTLQFNIDKANKISCNEVVQNNMIKGQKSINCDDDFGILTLHRPSNVDDKNTLTALIRLFIDDISQKIPLICPLHPRTQKKLKEFNLWDQLIESNKIIILNPLNYQSLLKFNIESSIMFTDSGGLQEECSILGTPCLTLRDNTERPITLIENGGTSIIVGNNIKKIKKKYNKIIKINFLPSKPKFWDGKTAKRCLNAIINYKNENL